MLLHFSVSAGGGGVGDLAMPLPGVRKGTTLGVRCYKRLLPEPSATLAPPADVHTNGTPAFQSRTSAAVSPPHMCAVHRGVAQ